MEINTEGLTTSYNYDDNLTDGVGLDATYATQLAQLNITFGPKATGSAMAVTNPAGETSVQIQDGIGRTVMTINPEGDTATMAYDVLDGSVGVPPAITIPGNLLVTSSTDANGNTNKSYTDAAGRTIAAEDADGNISGAAYDANSNTILTADPNGLGQTCTYDALNRQTECADKQEQAESTNRTTEYNAASQVINSTNAEGEITSNAYDERNRLINSTDPNNITTSYTYDANNNLISLTDGNNNTRLWFYEERNLNRTKAYPDDNQNNDFYSQNFDALGRVKIKVDQAGTTVTMIYDLAGRLTEKQYHTGATPASDPAQTVVITQGPTLESTDTFSYDAESRITETVKGRHGITTSHTYAADSQPLTETVAADNRTYTQSRTYDDGNRPLTHTYPDGKTTHWSYTARNLVNTVHYEDKIVLTNTHDAAYRLTNETLGNGLARAISYGRQDNLRTTDTTFDGAQALDDLNFSYSYAADKQITAENIVGDVIQNTSFTASYDAGNRITNWTRDTNNNQSWNYDDAGNWSSTTVASTSSSISPSNTRNHSVSDQITSIAGNAAVHDAKGNLTEYEINTKQYNVEYDLENRIIKVDVNNSDVEYRYDAFGRQIIRKEGSNKTALLWWGDSECAEYEHNAGQATIQNDIMSHPSALNAVIARAVDGSKFDLEFYHKNYLDHVYAVSDDTGNLNEHYRYTAFGEVTIYNNSGTIQSSSQINNTIMWNTRHLDSVSNYYLYKYRHYDPALGRWPSRDPIEARGGINLYAFVGNNGVNSWDYMGLKEFKVTITVGPDVGAGISSNGSIGEKYGEAIRRESGGNPANFGYALDKPAVREAHITAQWSNKLKTLKNCKHTIKIKYTFARTLDEARGSLDEKADYRVLIGHGDYLNDGNPSFDSKTATTGLIFGLIPIPHNSNKTKQSWLSAPVTIENLLSPYSTGSEPQESEVATGCCRAGKLPEKIQGHSVVVLGKNTGEKQEVVRVLNAMSDYLASKCDCE